MRRWPWRSGTQAVPTLRITPFAVLLPGEPEPAGAAAVIDWQAATAAALQRLDEGKAGAVRCVVDDRLSIAAVLSGPLAWLPAHELEAAARAWLAHRLGSADTLAVRAVPQPDGRHAAACALPAALVEGVSAAVAAAGLRLLSLRPHWAAALAPAEHAGTGARSAALLVAAPAGDAGGAPGVHALGLRERGSWLALSLEVADGRPHGAAAAARAMLRRELAFGRVPAGVMSSTEGLWLARSDDEAAHPGPADWTQPVPRSSSAGATAHERPPGPYSLNGLDFAATSTAVPRAGLAVAAAGAVLLLTAAAQVVLGERGHAAMETAIADLRARPLRSTALVEAVPLPVPAAELHALGVSLSWPLLPALDQLAAVRAPGILLTRLEPLADAGPVAPTGAVPTGAPLRLRVAAQAPSAAAAASWSSALAATPGFDAVRLLSLESGAAGPDVRFELDLVRHGH